MGSDLAIWAVIGGFAAAGLRLVGGGDLLSVVLLAGGGIALAVGWRWLGRLGVRITPALPDSAS